MILVDTSVWVAHLDAPDAVLSGLLKAKRVVTHALVIEELFCGRGGRDDLIENLAQKRSLPRAEHDEIMHMIRAHSLQGSGIGAIDAHLLAAARLSGARLYTLDRALARAAERLGVLHAPRRPS